MIQSHIIWPPDTGITGLEACSIESDHSHMRGIRESWRDIQRSLKGSDQLLAFNEKLGREWAIETGIIEGLYDIDRGITQTLIEHGLRAELLHHGATNKPREHVIRLIRDHESALEGIFDFVKEGRELSISYIKELHSVLLRSQDTVDVRDQQGRYLKAKLVKGDWKSQPNYPERDGVIYTYCPPEHVASEMDRLLAMHAGHVHAGIATEVQAAWLHHRFTQIHPFQDGNGRVVRAIVTALLVKDGFFPMIVRWGDRKDYLDALEAADNGNLQPLVKLMTSLQSRQFRKAGMISMGVPGIGGGVSAALSGLTTKASVLAGKRREDLKQVFTHATVVKDKIHSQLSQVTADLQDALRQFDSNANVLVRCSEPSTSHYFRSQIIENARNKFEYFANTSDYREWVALNLYWTRRAKLVFTLHGIGGCFNGSLICAPFLEFRDQDDEGQIKPTLSPVANDGFVFFHNEEQAQVLSRFDPWCERVIEVAIMEVTQNL